MLSGRVPFHARTNRSTIAPTTISMISPAVADCMTPLKPDRCRMSGWMGARVTGNARARLAQVDTERLLEGYRKRPGRQAWDGEHVGKWLHAASLAWSSNRDPELRAKLDATVAELMRHQLSDGYLGTYLPEQRWTEWDVWAHKYNLIGLLTYVETTGVREPIETCRRMGDLLLAEFGDAPGKRDIIAAGHHVGMAPTSVLEGMVWLYRCTGDQRYLDFCNYLFRAWEQPNGPRIVSTLFATRRVSRVGNGKAYELLSCLNGALEFFRTTGNRPEILEAALIAWEDIVNNQLYPTGASSQRERYYDEPELSNTNNVGETCVTVTWLQFNLHLLRLTGEVRFADHLEKVVLNQLFGAQHPSCTSWGYYVQMEGRKPYNSLLDGHCCLSSGPRGVALIPTFVVMSERQDIVINLYEAGVFDVPLGDLKFGVQLKVETVYPLNGEITIRFTLPERARFAVKFRVPDWCRAAEADLNGEPFAVRAGFNRVERWWSPDDCLHLRLPMTTETRTGIGLNRGKVAFMRGPLVMAALESGEVKLASLVLAAPDAEVPQGFAIKPFAEAGAGGERYRVWLPLPGGRNLFANARCTCSRGESKTASITDEDVTTFVTTRDGKSAPEDWFAVEVDSPVTFSVVRFAHGASDRAGGWFVGKPRVQVKANPEAPWRTIGVLESYPATTQTDSQRLLSGWLFTFRVANPITAVALRVIGEPACGQSTTEAFASAAELQAYAD